MRSRLLTFLFTLWFPLLIACAAVAQPSIFDFKKSKPVFDPPGAVVGVITSGAVANLSGMEIQVGGAGIYLMLLNTDNASTGGTSYIVTVDSASVLTTITETVTPTMTFGTGTISSVIRGGRTASAALGSGPWHTQIKNTTLESMPIFIPPGRFLTIRRNAQNTTASVAVGFVELQP